MKTTVSLDFISNHYKIGPLKYDHNNTDNINHDNIM